jgi:hypothetical protein
VFDVALCAALTLSLWNLYYDGESHLLYLSNWMVVFNVLFYVAVAASETLPGFDRIALLGNPLLLSSNILWLIYTLGLVFFGASCFAYDDDGVFGYIVFAACALYNHASPFALSVLYTVYRFEDSVRAWAVVIDSTIGTWDHTTVGRARTCAFFGTLAWLAVPALPCVVYSSLIDPLGVYGLSISRGQLGGIIMFSVCAHAVAAMAFLYFVLHYRAEKRRLSAPHTS